MDQHRSSEPLSTLPVPESPSHLCGIIEEILLPGEPGKRLSDSTFVVKDLFDVKGSITGVGSPDWKRTHDPASETAPVVSLLIREGATFIGKSLTDEMAFSLDGINAHYGTPLNTLYPDRIPGGSSSGSVSAVAACLADFGIGSDTAGSIRVPSAYCGLYGFRPSHGIIDMTGAFPLGPSFDTVGWCARTAEMLERVGTVLLGATDEPPTQPFRKIWMVENCFAMLDAELGSEFRNTSLLMAERIGLPAEWLTLPETFLDECVDCFNVIRCYEAWSLHGTWVTENNPDFGPGVRERVHRCSTVSLLEMEEANRHRAVLADWLHERLLDSLLLFPTTWKLPPLRDAGKEELMENRRQNVKLCTMSSLFGLPQITIPVTLGIHGKLALSLVAPRTGDCALLSLVRTSES